jgi:large subunit ribosomal protein L25
MATQAATVTVKPRSELGSRANKRLRDAGLLPGVIYGHKEAVIPITLPKKEVVTHLTHGAHLFDLAIDGKSEKLLIKEVQYDHLGIEVIHVDFDRVSLDEKVEVKVRVELKGTPKGEEEGAVLQQIMAELEIECLVTEIPEVVRHNVSEMEKDSVLHIKDLQLPPGVKCLQDPELIVATVREIQEEVAATEAAEGESAEPEVIGKGKEEAAEEGAEGAAAAGGGAAPAAKKE